MDNPEKTFYSSNRIYFAEGQWYFLCRELPSVGPFDSRDDAEFAIHQFSHDVLGFRHRLSGLENFDWS